MYVVHADDSHGCDRGTCQGNGTNTCGSTPRTRDRNPTTHVTASSHPAGGAHAGCPQLRCASDEDTEAYAPLQDRTDGRPLLTSTHVCCLWCAKVAPHPHTTLTRTLSAGLHCSARGARCFRHLPSTSSRTHSDSASAAASTAVTPSVTCLSFVVHVS